MWYFIIKGIENCHLKKECKRIEQSILLVYDWYIVFFNV